MIRAFSEAKTVSLDVILPPTIEYLQLSDFDVLIGRPPKFPVFIKVMHIAATLPDSVRERTFSTLLECRPDWFEFADKLPDQFLSSAIGEVRKLTEREQVKTLLLVANGNVALRPAFLEEAWEVATGTRENSDLAEYLTDLAPYMPRRVFGVPCTFYAN
jgi:hypothetical protein